MAEFEIKDGVAIIPEGTEKINPYSFEDVEGLTTVVIPKSVVKIDKDHLWSSLSGVTKIIVEEGNERYDSRNNCNAIIETESNTLVAGCASTVIPDTVEEIGESAFFGCKGLTSVVIPNSVTSIGEHAFQYCRDLTSVVIPNGVTSIEEYTFCNCEGLTSVEIPNSVTSIGEDAFNGCTSLTSVTIPEGVTSIGKEAFADCSALTTVTLPKGVNEMPDAFLDCTGITTINIPAKKTDYYKKRLPEELHQFIVEMEPEKKAKKK